MIPLVRRLRSTLALLGLLACWHATAGIFTAAAAERPKVVLVLCDDIRWDALSCAGHPHVKTPHIDRLAAEGLSFENMFCTTSLCSPSRASILSGLYAHRHGVTNHFNGAQRRVVPGYYTTVQVKQEVGLKEDPMPLDEGIGQALRDEAIR